METNHSETFPEYSGYIAAAVSCAFLGTNLLPVKKYEVGDGMVFQWVACSGVFFIGMIVHCARNFPKFFALPMIGGAMWATGNCCVVGIIKTVGLSLGVLIWGTFNMIVGWACGRFGWFGLTPEVPQHPILNYVGVACGGLSIPIYFCIMLRNGMRTSAPPLIRLQSDLAEYNDGSNVPVVHSPESIDVIQLGFWDSFSLRQKRIIGCCLCVFSGTIYGFYFTPVTYLIDHPYLYPGASLNGLDHVFSLCCGIFLASTAYFLLYCIVKRNRPVGIPHEALMPAFISGAMWAVANAGWMLANTTISEAISFPIITTVPALISTCWGVFYFREIKGLLNFLLVGLAFSLTVTGALLCGFSRPGTM